MSKRTTERIDQAGHSFVELVVVLALVGLLAAFVSVAWTSYLRRTATMQTARLVQSKVSQARMLAVYRGLNHFVVLDPGRRLVSVFQDSGAPFGELDASDRRVSVEPWPETVRLALPPRALSLPDPMGGASLDRAWSLPEPSGEGWQSGMLGVLATPAGSIASADDAPSVIAAGTIVFSDARGNAVSVGIRGRFGTVDWFRLESGAWRRG